MKKRNYLFKCTQLIRTRVRTQFLDSWPIILPINIWRVIDFGKLIQTMDPLPKMNIDMLLFCLQFWGEVVNYPPPSMEPILRAPALHSLPLSSAGLWVGWEPKGACILMSLVKRSVCFPYSHITPIFHPSLFFITATLRHNSHTI